MLFSANYKDEKYIKEKISKELLETPYAVKVLAYWLLGFLLIFLIVLFLPWQQNIRAEGTVTTLTPQDRPQKVESAIAGRIISWRVREGQYIKDGDTIAVLAEIKEKYFDPDYLQRLSEIKTAKQQSIAATGNKVQALTTQIDALQQAVGFSLEKAQNKLKQTRLKMISDSMDFQAEKMNFQVAKRQLDASQNMLDKGLIALVQFETRKLKLQESTAKLLSTENKFLAAKQDLLNAYIELNSIQADYTDKISKAKSDQSSSRAYFAESTGELSKISNEYVNMKIRSEQYYILAPQSGYVVKTLHSGIGETIKEQEAVVMIMPAHPTMAVELYVKPMDVPLLSIGRKVRLEFDGWPALQFSGWPAVAIGTFGGVISVIDAVDSKAGKYRILVSPDDTDEIWPRQLRQGSGVKGWAMLDDVAIWYELWRQLNAFPPSLKEKPDDFELLKE